jgi:Pyruvate/2-oxoacid:ferredoxin oxidoreductase delta subunit
MEIMKRAEREGLVHETINIQNTSVFICNCCSCCCGFLKSVKELDNKKAVVISNFDPIINYDQCESCKTCINICPMSAIDYVEEKPIIRSDDCLGCGLCASNCPQNAITLKKVRNTIPIKSTLKLLRTNAKRRKQILSEQPS